MIGFLQGLGGGRRRFMLFAMAALSAAFLVPARPTSAHEASMAVMVLREVGPGRYLGQWSMPPIDERLRPIFPEHCAWDPPELDCGERGFVGTLSFMGLGSKQSVAMFRVFPLEGPAQAYTVSAANPIVTAARDPGRDIGAWLNLADTYVNLGIDHILRGIDHLLFVLGLIWLVRDRWMLVRTITAFTVAHSLSLAAATFGWVGVPERPLNATIALSIVFVGVEIVKLQRGQVGLAARYPWVVAFAFGLLHGLGFATALTTLGIPQTTLPFALLFFNIGVEIGQLAFVFVVLALIWAHHRVEATLPRWGAVLPAYAIGSIAAFWFLVRV
ncbi:HupE/UreJ family protein [Methylocapsa aurea]|uniref:HupE/UreJ family protein n=1 Tax=Methylocapsa aurea TaxID=663610 RepID=UPI000A497772|nr:HupE/UreJ family protein [Methylocapsa aurea]